VSRQIALLFKDAPDLRADFRSFMPEQSRQLPDELPPQVSPVQRTETPLNDARTKRKLDAVANAASLPAKRKRKIPEKESVPLKPVQVVAVRIALISSLYLITIHRQNLIQVQSVLLLDMETKRSSTLPLLA